MRVIVVPQSNEYSFHRPAANALLKSIEEPPANCLFFFFADSTDDVLATIVSRCQVVPVNQGMALGYWKSAAADGLDEEVVRKLDAARAQFIMNARKVFGSGNMLPQVRAVSDSLELSHYMQDLVKELDGDVDEYDASQRLVDLVVSSEIEVLKDDAHDNAACARYMSRVCDLAEKTRRQLGSFVQPKNALENFCLALGELRQAHSGEISCAKR
jgi:hypothetical protein